MKTKEKILEALPGTLREITAAIELNPSAIDKHIRKLVENGIVEIAETIHTGKRPMSIYRVKQGYVLPEKPKMRPEPEFMGPIFSESMVGYALRRQPQIARVWA